MPSHNALSLTARFDRNLINADGDSVRFLAVTITPPRAELQDQDRPSLNLALVIDASGSMSGSPLMAAKEAVIGVARGLRDSDRLSVVSFASDVQVHCDALLQSGSGRERAIALIGSLATRGSTDLAAGWLSGCECVARAMEGVDRLQNNVVLLSDGHANSGEVNPAVLARHASELRVRGVFSSTVGIGVHYSPTQLQAIAENGGGRMHDAERSEEIVEIVRAELQQLTLTTAENVELIVTAPSGVRIEPVGAIPHAREDADHRFVLGAMTSEVSRTVVLKLTTPRGIAGGALSVGVSASWRKPGDPQPLRTAGTTCDVRFALPRECEVQDRDGAVAIQVARLWQAAIVHHVMSLNDRGAYQEARGYIDRETKWFERYCRDLPGADELVHQLRRLAPTVDAAYEPVAAKEMMLRSYKANRAEQDHRSAKRPAWQEHIRP